jgi:hypothetical protein
MRVMINGQEVQPGGNRPRRRGGCGPMLGLLVGFGGLVIAAFAVWQPSLLANFAMQIFQQGAGRGAPIIIGSTPNNTTDEIQTRPVEGDPAKFDPLAGYAAALAFAGEGAVLVSMEASQVRPDGTTDLTATYTSAPYVEYEFVIPIPRPANAPPVGAGGTEAGQWYQPIIIRAFQPGQQRRVTTTGGGIGRSYTYTNQGMSRELKDPTTKIDLIRALGPSGEGPAEATAAADQPSASGPACSFVDFWQAALERDAPPDAVAKITYDADGYEFRISGARVNLDFGFDCTLQ